MYFKEIYFDSFYKDSFDQIAIQEKWINSRRGEEKLLFTSDTTPRKIRDKSKVLQLLTLFEKIDMPLSEYALDSLINAGLIKKTARTLDVSWKDYVLPYNKIKQSSNLDKQDKVKASYSRKTAFEIIRLNKNKFLNRLFQNYKYDYIDRYKNDRIPAKKEIELQIDKFINNFENIEFIDDTFDNDVDFAYKKGNFYKYIDDELLFLSHGIIDGI